MPKVIDPIPKRHDKVIKIIKNQGFKLKYYHLANSLGLIYSKKLGLDKITNLARCGRTLYGIYRHKKNGLRQALKLKSHIVQLKKIKKREKVGYNLTYQAEKDTVLAIIPIGYNDGVDLRLSNKGHVLVGNTSCPIVGRVSMNITVCDVTSVNNPAVGQTVEIYPSIEKVAEIINTLPHEILVHLNPQIKRVVVD